MISRVSGLSFPVVLGLYLSLVTSAALIVEYGLVSKFHVDANAFYPIRRDLALHAMAFTGLTLPALCLFRPKLPVLVACLGFGVMLEVAQYFTPDREPSLADVAADAVGILVAAVLYRALKQLVPMVIAQVVAGFRTY